MAAQAMELASNPGNCQDVVDDPRIDGAARHAIELRRLGILREGDPVSPLDRRQPFGAVRASPGEHDTDRLLPQLVRKRREEGIHGQV
jgi:hypothetical protein